MRAYLSHIFCKTCVYSYTHLFRTPNKSLRVFTMPKDRSYLPALQANRIKLREKKTKYISRTAFIQILGSGARGAPRSIYFFTDYCRYMFNCGEGTQRLAHEHKMKISRLEHIFITHPSWENLGGLPGLALTIQDVGVPDLTIHGPCGIDSMFAATSRFVVLNNLQVKMADCGREAVYDDPAVTIYYVPLKKNQEGEGTLSSGDSSSNFSNVSLDDNQSVDDIDYYAHMKKKSTPFKSPERKVLTLPKVEKYGAVAMSYVGKLKPKLGTLNLKACVEHGVPPGPLLGKLKNGEDITLPDGKLVKSSDVKDPDDPGPVFIIVDCPSTSFLDSFLNEEKFKEHQIGANCENIAKYVFHFTPSIVMTDERYKLWMNKFPDTTLHINVNDSNTCLGNVGPHILQRQLNHLDSEIFPLLHDQSIPIVDVPLNKKLPMDYESISKRMKHSVNNSGFPVHAKDLNIPPHVGHTLKFIDLWSSTDSDTSQNPTCVYMNPKSMIEDLYFHEEFKPEYELFKSKVSAISNRVKSDNESNPFPIITFLGTGSSIPNKNRNTSGILITFGEDNHMIMDCGEGTYDQLVRLFGADETDRILISTKAIYVSHLHADHHLGAINLLQKRRDAYHRLSIDLEKLYLLAPKQIGYWFYTYNLQFELIHDCYTHIYNQDLVKAKNNNSSIKSLLEALNVKEIKTVEVIHCPHSFGVSVVDSKNQKITYSGDTMPSKNLVELGKNSDVLIHEATFEDGLKHEARIKMHSTFSEAITVGKDMKAKFTILTHFSQRYYKIPLINERFDDTVGVAFDNMRVRLGDLKKLPLLNPLLKIIFSEEQEIMESKVKRRKN